MWTPFSKEGLMGTKPKNSEILPDDHWFSVTKELYKNMGEEPSPAQIRSGLAIGALKLPSGQTSALETDTDGNRTNPRKDEVIAKLFTNESGIMINRKTGIVSLDPRDVYPNGLPSELKEVLDSKTAEIIHLMYDSKKSTRDRFGNTKNKLKAERPFNYFRLPGGVDLFIIGYGHDADWHENHQEFLAKIGKCNPAVIGIEGFADISSGESLEKRWGDSKAQQGHYDKLMKQLVENGFTGLFTEVDVRDESMISMDAPQELPEDFFKKDFTFFEREEPGLANKLGTNEGLKSALQKQSTSGCGVVSRRKTQYKKGTLYCTFPYLKENGDTSAVPTGLELGQFIFSDALTAVKLHMTAKLMADGHIPKGPIVDFEGYDHLPSKAFFIHNLEYAMLIVFRMINELMAGRVKKKDNIEEIYDVFDNPNWTEVVKEIASLHFSKVDTTKGNSVEIGNDQYPIIRVLIDFLKIYNINPTKVIPSDEEIKAIIQKLT